jgi:hypothetical protein
MRGTENDYLSSNIMGVIRLDASVQDATSKSWNF